MAVRIFFDFIMKRKYAIQYNIQPHVYVKYILESIDTNHYTIPHIIYVININIHNILQSIDIGFRHQC